MSQRMNLGDNQRDTDGAAWLGKTTPSPYE